MKKLSTLDNNFFFTELVLEKCMEAVHVLEVEQNASVFVATFFWTNESEKQGTIAFCLNLSKNKGVSYMEASRDMGDRRSVLK